jgi:hypothetical protein
MKAKQSNIVNTNDVSNVNEPSVINDLKSNEQQEESDDDEEEIEETDDDDDDDDEREDNSNDDKYKQFNKDQVKQINS